MRGTNEEEVAMLIQQSLTGDKAAFSRIYDLTVQDMIGTVRFLLEDRASMEDVIQEIYIEAYKSLEKFDRTRSFRSWMIGIAIRQVNNYRRKTWRLFRLLEKKQQYAVPIRKGASVNEKTCYCCDGSCSNYGSNCGVR
jgi:RNA polymerase sigma-70 factor (ECF subfamily)